MIKKILFLFAIILMIPSCVVQQEKINPVWPSASQSKSRTISPHAKPDDLDDIVIFLLCFMLLIGIGLGYFFYGGKPENEPYSMPLEQKRPLPHSYIKPFFMPHEGQSCIRSLLQDLKNAQEKIYIASYWVTNEDIIKALKIVRKRNVLVEIIFDKSTPGAAILQQEFRNSGIKFTESEVDSALMHHKFIIVDNTITWVGSANLTWTAFSQNYENMVRIESPEIAQQYLIDFENLTKEFDKFAASCKSSKASRLTQ